MSPSVSTLKTIFDSFRMEQVKEEIDADAIKADTQSALDTLQDLQSQFEVVRSILDMTNWYLIHWGR